MKKFTSIKQIPKAAIEMIDDVQWWFRPSGYIEGSPIKLHERLSSEDVLAIVKTLKQDGTFTNNEFQYSLHCESSDKSWGKILYEKIHGLA